MKLNDASTGETLFWKSRKLVEQGNVADALKQGILYSILFLWFFGLLVPVHCLFAAARIKSLDRKRSATTAWIPQEARGLYVKRTAGLKIRIRSILFALLSRWLLGFAPLAPSNRERREEPNPFKYPLH
jgi:hypothetical protein